MKKSVLELLVVFLVGLTLGLGEAIAEGPQSGTLLVDATGKVWVNAGEGFKIYAGGGSLKSGDRVLVGENSKAVIKYGSCEVIVVEPSVYTVLNKSPCAEGDLPSEETHAGPSGLPAAVALPVLSVGGMVVGCVVACGDLLGDKNVPASVSQF